MALFNIGEIPSKMAGEYIMDNVSDKEMFLVEMATGYSVSGMKKVLKGDYAVSERSIISLQELQKIAMNNYMKKKEKERERDLFLQSENLI